MQHIHPIRTKGRHNALAAAATVLAIWTSPVAAAGSFEGTYLCIEEFGGGVAYNEQTKNWTGTVFDATGKFILSMKLVGSGTATGTTVAENYEMIATDVGTDVHEQCTFSGGFDDRTPVSVDPAFGFVNCWAGLENYRVDFKTQRFIRFYPIGYVLGADNRDNTPSLMGGTCTKVD